MMTKSDNQEQDITKTKTVNGDGRKTAAFSLVWGALIIASALVIDDKKAATAMLFLLIAGWAVTVPYVGGFRDMMACERRMLRRFMGQHDTGK